MAASAEPARYGSGQAARRLLTALAGDRSGVAALEFALLLVPFLGLTFAVIETALMTFADAVLQGGMTTAARLVRTGQIQDAGGCPANAGNQNLQAFLTALRGQLAGPIDPAKVAVDVNSFASFAGISLPAPNLDNSGRVINTCFNTGGPSSVVAVRVFYVWRTLTPGLSYLLGSAANQDFLLQHTVVFRNEPY